MRGSIRNFLLGKQSVATPDAIVDLGLAVWNTATIYPVITLEEAVGGLPE